ncbi:uncharacterized protein LOC120334504 isoform X8 [Styela clava]
MEQDAAIKEIGNGDKISLKLPGQDETISDNLNEQSQVNNSDLTKFIKSEKKVQDTLKTSSQVSATCESNGADERHEKILSDRVESLASDISVSNVNSTEEQVLGLKLPVQIEDKPEHRLADVQEMTSVIVTKPSTSSSISLNRELQESGRKVEEIDIQLHCKLDDAKKKVSVYETNSSSFINTKKDQTVGIDSKIIFRDRRLAKVNGNPFQNFPKIYGDYRIKPKVTLLPKVTGTLPIPIRRCEVKFDNKLKTLSRQIPFFGDKRVKFQESNSDDDGEEYFAINEDVDSDDSDTQNNDRKKEKLDEPMEKNHHDDAESCISNGKEENLSLQLKGFCIEGTKFAPKLPPKEEEIMEEIDAGCDEDVIEPSRVKTNRRIKTARRRPMGCDEDVIEPSRVKTNRRLKTARRRPMGCDEDVIEPSRVKTNRRLKTARRRPMGDSNSTLNTQVLSREIPHYGGFRKHMNYGIELNENKKDDEDMESIEEFIINGDSDSSIRKESENKYCENFSSNELLEEIEEKIDKGDNKLSSNQKVNSSAIKSLLNRKQKGGKKKNQKQIAPMPSATANKPCPPDNKKKGAEKSTKQPKGSTGKSSGKKPKGTAKSGNLDDTSKKKTTEQPNLAPKKRKGKFKGVLKALSRIIPHQDHSEDKPNAKIRNLLQGNGKINKKCGTKQQNSNQEMEKNSSYDGMNAVKQEGIVPFVSAGEMQFYDRRIPVENDKMAKMDRKDDKDSSSGDESIIFLTEPPSKKVSRAKKFFRRIGRF